MENTEVCGPITLNLYASSRSTEVHVFVSLWDIDPQDNETLLSSHLSNIVTVYHDAEHPSHLLLPITRGNIVGTYLSGGDISIRELKLD